MVGRGGAWLVVVVVVVAAVVMARVAIALWPVVGIEVQGKG